MAEPGSTRADDMGPGHRVGGYTLERPLAAGGFGTIWRAADAHGRAVALKVLHADLVGSEELVLRFEREARAINLIHHPNVVELFDFGELPDGRPYFAMELLTGSDLTSHLDHHGALPAGQALAILEPLCDALAVAHDNGIVHRDLKGSNVFLSEGDGDRRVVLLDFGVAKILGDAGPQLTASRCVVGSPTCMSPEQIRGEPVTTRTDVYALGTLSYQMLTGETPFAGVPPLALQYMHLHGRRPRPSGKAALPPAIDEVIVRAMSKSAPDRYEGPREFVAAFRAVVGTAGESTATRSVGVLVEAIADPAALDDPDDALIDDLETVLAVAVGRLRKAGFAVAEETGPTALLARPLPPGTEHARRSRADAVNTAQRTCELLERRHGRDPRVRVRIRLHIADAIIAGDAARPGALVEMADWYLDDTVADIVGSEAVFEGLDTQTRALRSDRSLLAVR